VDRSRTLGATVTARAAPDERSKWARTTQSGSLYRMGHRLGLSGA